MNATQKRQVENALSDRIYAERLDSECTGAIAIRISNVIGHTQDIELYRIPASVTEDKSHYEFNSETEVVRALFDLKSARQDILTIDSHGCVIRYTMTVTDVTSD